MLDTLKELSDPEAFGLITLFVTGDAIFPMVPGETATYTGGVLASHGDLSILIVILATWTGALIGDNLCFLIGRSAGRRLTARRGPRFQQRLRWAEDRLAERGGVIVLTARFVPGGRNAVNLTAGTLGMSWTSFARWNALAGLLWALFASGVGYLSGETFEGNLLISLITSMLVAALVGAGGELWVRRRGVDSPRGDPCPDHGHG